MLLRLVCAMATASPHVAVIITAVVTSMAATYPTMFCGRSLVSPNNGGTVMLYNRPPFVPGSEDTVIEDRRGADVGAMMWAFVPYSQVQRDALAHGEWPLWNRHNSLGVPLWGQGQTFLLDPLHWLTLATADLAHGWDLKFIAHRFVFAWGIGIAALAATGSWAAASLATASASLAGLYVFRLNHPAVFSVTYAPSILLGWHLLGRAATWRARACGALVVAAASALVLVASPPKEAAVGLVVAECTGVLIVLLTSSRSHAPALRALIAGAAAGIAAILLTAPHWLVFLDTLHLSRTMYDNSVLRLGGSDDAWGLVIGPFAALQRPGLHLLSTVLVLAALGAPSVRRQPMTMACLFGSVGALAIMFGAIPAEWLMKVPLVANISGIDNDLSTAVLVPLLVVSAAGAQALFSGCRTSIVVATAGMLLVGGWLVLVDPAVAGMDRLDRWLVGLAIVLAALTPVVLAACGKSVRLRALIAAGILVTALLLPGGQHLETGATALDRLLQQPRPRTNLLERSSSVRAFHALATEPTRVSGVDTWLSIGTQALYGLEGPAGSDSLFLPRTVELLETPDPSARIDWARYFKASDLDRDAALLDMLNVGYLLAHKEKPPDGISPEPIAEDDELRLFRRSTAWPRAYFVDRIGTYTTPNDLVAQARAARHAIATVQVGDREATDVLRLSTDEWPLAQPADRYVLTPNVTSFRVRAVDAGVAVLAESYVPGDFIATLNGQTVPYFRVNHAFKGVRIPRAGDWDVRFEYRPRRWALALWLAAIGSVIVVAMAVAAIRIGEGGA